MKKVHAVVARGDVEVKGVKNGLVPAGTLGGWISREHREFPKDHQRDHK